MNKLFPLLLFAAIFTSCNSSKEETTSFYEVPLTCGADNEIGCGSRLKPLFIETAKEKAIKESWANRKGTVIAIVWSNDISKEEKEKIILPLFEQFEIDAKYISDEEKQKQISESFTSAMAPSQKNDKWYKGMDVDQLSIEEAAAMGDSATIFAVNARLINADDAAAIKKEIEDYMKIELVKVRSYKELTSMDTDLKWKQKGYEIYVKYIGIDRAEKVRDYFLAYKKNQAQTKSCCDKKENMNTTSEITCPFCGHKKTETMPNDVCQLVYTCEKCKKDIRAKEGDCCVFCSYGDHKCPSEQAEGKD